MLTALFTDADRKSRDVYDWLLTSYGFQVETAGDGLECLDKLRQFVPDLLIFDLDMPWGGGDGLLGVIRKDRRLLPIRVVLTSAIAPMHVLEGQASPPVVQTLTKPFQLSALFERAALAAFMQQAYEQITTKPRSVLLADDELAVVSRGPKCQEAGVRCRREPRTRWQLRSATITRCWAFPGTLTIKRSRTPSAGSRCTIILRGKGLPDFGGRKRGDLFIVLQLSVPKRLTPQERDLYERLRSMSREDNKKNKEKTRA